MAANADKSWRGGPGFPYAWIDIEVFCGEFVQQVISKSRSPSRLRSAQQDLAYFVRAKGQLSKAAWLARRKVLIERAKATWHFPATLRSSRDFLKIEAEARAWVERASAAGRFTAVDERSRQNFGHWYDGIVARADNSHVDPRHWTTLRSCIAEAYRVGPRLCLQHSAKSAAFVPTAWQQDQRWQFAIRYSDTGGGRIIRHQLLGPRRSEMVPNASELRRHQLELVPLMRFDSQSGLFWMWGDVGAIEFRIREADLATLNFGNVVVKLV